MKTGLVLLCGCVALVVPASVSAHQDNSEPATYELRMGAPNRGVAPNGDTVSLTCNTRQGACGTFRIHPKGLPTPPSGEFVHTFAGGGSVAGTWTATDLISFESYGCGIVAFAGIVLPPNFCGGALKLRVELTTSFGTAPGVLTVFCIVGPNPPEPHSTPPGEGVTLNVPGVINFNHTDGGMNVYVRTGA